jgi:thymidylate kinase
MDGAGKTTQAQILADHLRSSGLMVREIHLLTQGNTASSSLESRSLYRRLQKKLQALPVSGPGAGVKLLIGITAYCCDAWLTAARHQRSNGRRVQVTIYDRYYYDQLALFATAFDRVPIWTADMTDLMPSPNLAIGMEVSSQVGHMRKPEEPLAKLSRCRRYYRRIARSIDGVLLDGTQAIERIARQVQYLWETSNV